MSSKSAPIDEKRTGVSSAIAPSTNVSIRTFFLLLLTQCYCIAFTYAQKNAGSIDLQGTMEKLAAYHETYPQEKVYLHLDKPYYSVGDDIWFMAYLTLGPQNLLSAMGGIVYVDLIGPDNQLVRSRRLPVLSGLSMGDFQLADSLREGNYRIRAYTSWMRNFDEDLFFQKSISVGNALTDKLLTYTDFTTGPDGRGIQADIVITELSGRPVTNREVTYELEGDERRTGRGKTTTDQQGRIYLSLPDKQPAEPQSGRIRLSIHQSEAHTAIHKTIPIKPIRLKNAIQFFPESGQLLVGSMSKVAFKALLPDGKGTAAQGYVTDNSGQRVTEFQTDYAGMGYFLLTPETGKIYTAHVTFADSTTTQAVLPAALASGYVLSVNNTADKAVFLQVATTLRKQPDRPCR